MNNQASMTDTNSYRKWFCRSALILLGLIATYVVLQPHYNFAHWVPHNLLRSAGVPYSALLAFESNADKLLHPVLAFVFTMLLFESYFSVFASSIYKPMLFLIIVMIVAELAQWYIGRGFDISDVLLGVVGSGLATLYLRRVST